MRNYIILNNQRSDEINGLIIQELASISKPLQRTQVETIDGRDGDIVTPLGYAAYDKKITIGLYGDFDINEIIAYFATQGTAIFSNEPDKYYNYQILDQIDYERLVRFRVATVTMHVQPFKYSATEGTLTIDASDTVSGEGSEIALDNTAEAPFTTLRHKGNATQTTYSGKNLFSGDFSQFDNTGGEGSTYAYFKLPTTGRYQLSLIAKSAITETTTHHFLGFTSTGGSGSSPLKWVWNNVSSATAGQKITISNLTTSDIELEYVSLFSASQSTLDWFNEHFYIQLELGSTATDYEPYVGGIPAPNPEFPMPISTVTGAQTVKVVGKNLLQVSNTQRTVNGVTFTPNADGSVTVDGTATYQISYPLNIDSATNYRTIHLPAGTYTISSNYPQSAGLGYFVQAQYGLIGAPSKYSVTQFTENGEMTVGAYIRVNQGATLDNVTFYPQLELGSTATAYEPYQGQSYEVNLGGKNLFNAEYYATATYTSGAYKYTATDFEGGKTYTFSATLKAGKTAMSGVYVCISDAANPNSTQNYMTPVYNGAPTVAHITATFASNATIYFQFYPTTLDIEQVFDTYDFQLEEGSARTPYQPFVPYHYELAKIGDYADEPVKVGDTWYIRRAIGKVVLDGSENWTESGYTNASIYSVYGGTPTIPDSPLLSSEFTYIGTIGSGTITEYVSSYNSAVLRLGVFKSRLQTADVAGLKTWLASNPTTVYYVLATPTDEEITDQDLIDALDELYGQAHSYKGHTHITATAEDGNAPAILSVEVGEDNESTVTNAGNTTSRPILTIYGQGDIGVYINDVEVLDIALGNEQYITLDSTEMDAYKDSPANLKNRLVTGDYSKLALNAGANKIRFTGTVTKYEISKYSRWL